MHLCMHLLIFICMHLFDIYFSKIQLANLNKFRHKNALRDHLQRKSDGINLQSIFSCFVSEPHGPFSLA